MCMNTHKQSPEEQRPQQEWIADQDIIPTVHDGFYALPRRLHRYSPLFEPVDHFLRGATNARGVNRCQQCPG